MKLSPCEMFHHGMIGLLILVNTVAVKYMACVISEHEKRYFSGNSVFDYYQYFRGMVLFAVCVVLLLVFMMSVLKKKISIVCDSAFLSMVAFVVTVAAAFLFSPYRDTADEGFIETYEGVSMLISYAVLAFLVSVMPLSRGLRKYYFFVFGTGLGIVTLASLLQHFGNDPLRWGIVTLYASSAFMPTLPPENEYGLLAHGLFSNPNYLSSYYSLFLPFLYFAFIQRGKWVKDSLLWLALVLCHYAVLASGTATALLLMPLGMVLTKGVCRDKLPVKRLAGWYLTYLLPLVVYYISSGNRSFEHEMLFSIAVFVVLSICEAVIHKLNWKAMIMVAAVVIVVVFWGMGEASIKGKAMGEQLESIRNENGMFQLGYDGRLLVIASEGDGFTLTDAATKESVSVFNTNSGTHPAFNTPVWIDKQSTEKHEIFLIQPYGIRFAVENHRLYYLNAGFHKDNLDQTELIGLRALDPLGTGRLYIWQRTLPLILKNPVFGTGPDTFGLVFPQNELPVKIQIYQKPYAFVTKAHNMYLNYAVNIGLAGLFAYMTLQIVVLKGLYRGVREHPEETLYAPLFVALLLYAILGMANDSRIYLSVYHWSLIGFSIALMRQNRGISINRTNEKDTNSGKNCEVGVI